MPIVNFHLVDGRHEDSAIGALLIEASIFYAETLYADIQPLPIERVRAFVIYSNPAHWATGGTLISEGGKDGPYFTCLTLTGRPTKQLHRLLSGFTDLLVRHLGFEHSSVRGRVIPVDPDHWAIGGVPASQSRLAEIAAREAG